MSAEVPRQIDKCIRGALALLAAVCAIAWLHTAPAEAALADSKIFPPGMIAPDPARMTCKARQKALVGDTERHIVNFVVTRRGKAINFAAMSGAPEWVVALAECALKEAKFVPATQLGTAIDHGASVELTFGPAGAGRDSAIRVFEFGPLVTGPRYFRITNNSLNCFPVGAGIEGELARYIVTLTIDPDGIPIKVELPDNADRWAGAATDCIMRTLVFYPSTRGGEPEQAIVKMPIAFGGPGQPVPSFAKVTAPDLQSDATELDAARASCVTGDLAVSGVIHYAFTIAEDGTASAPMILKGSGDARLDAAGNCILKRLRFTPLRVGASRQDVVVTWALRLGPRAGPP